jgi:hypothetical protein
MDHPKRMADQKKVLRLITSSRLVFRSIGRSNWLGASDLGPYLPIRAPERGAITHQPAAFREPAEGINLGDCMAGRKHDKLLTASDGTGQRSRAAHRPVVRPCDVSY